MPPFTTTSTLSVALLSLKRGTGPREQTHALGEYHRPIGHLPNETFDVFVLESLKQEGFKPARGSA
jgi:hypothetical protein